MVFIYHRLFKPNITQFEILPKFFRQAFFYLKRKYVPSFTQEAEPKYPIMKTQYPGPQKKNLMNDAEIITPDYQNSIAYINYEKSNGNYFTDCDGNQMIDMSSGALPLGYNHPKLIKFVQNNSFVHNFVNPMDINLNYPANLPGIIQNSIEKIEPKGLHRVQLTSGSGSGANEMAIKMSMQKRGRINKNTINANITDLGDKWQVLSFTGGYHGCLSTSVNGRNNKWPVAPFPSIKHPINKNSYENEEEIKRCLSETEKILRENSNICAMIIEPVQCEAGDSHSTPEYFRQLRTLSSLYNVDFIVDEVNTGLSGGRYWMHELWDLQTPPDLVTFSNKFQVSGVFLSKDFLGNQLLNSNFVGEGYSDVYRLNILSKILEIIEDDDLFSHSEKAAEYFKSEVEEIMRTNDAYSEIRGRGNLLSFSMKNKDQRDLFGDYARNCGVLVLNIGERSIGIRSSLVIEKKHYQNLISIMKRYNTDMM